MRALAAMLVLIAAPAQADETRRSMLSPLEAAWQPEAESALPAPYGSGGTRRFSAGFRGARDFNDNTDVSLFLQPTWFVVDDVEIGFEAAGWWIFQDNVTWGVSTSLVTRYHFFRTAALSGFVEGGMGVFLAADNVPDTGTSFGFMPRIGAGTSIKLDERDTRLLVGVHWHHISNARLNGEARNPARDGVGLFVSVSVPF